MLLRSLDIIIPNFSSLQNVDLVALMNIDENKEFTIYTV